MLFSAQFGRCKGVVLAETHFWGQPSQLHHVVADGRVGAYVGAGDHIKIQEASERGGARPGFYNQPLEITTKGVT